MENNYLLDSLNDGQKQAVSAPPSNLLVLAGAGSGKTRVLVHRIAWLMEQHHVSPFAILAVTFTNKAAYAMRGRIEELLNRPLSGMWVGTFHGLAHRLLRAHWLEAELPENFQILDSDDQYRLVRRIMRSQNIDDTKWPPKQAQWYINKCKEEGKRARDIKNNDHSYFEEVMHKIYSTYEETCQRSGLVDFSELLLRSLELLENNTDLANHYRSRFKHILVDEFQDTNTIQYRWLMAIKGPQSFIMAVGDDDQSIYSWRGAKIDNMLNFSKQVADSETIRLEQNYRSTKTILDAANAVIENNDGRLGKKLWTGGDEGQKITLYAAFNERDEAYYTISSIKDLERQGFSYSDIAILYRSNAQSRIFEEQLLDAQLPYRIYGGLKFFERAEIKDALAYLRMIGNRNDDAALERIINVPARSIGNTTLNVVREIARDESVSMWDAIAIAISSQSLKSRAISSLSYFVDLINDIQRETESVDLGEQTLHILQRSGLLDMYKKDRSEKGLSKVENLEELVTATSQFKPGEDEEGLSPLNAFLAHVALETGETQSESFNNCISLMTLHAAKGLEFPIVFIVGLEEDLFPHKMSVDEPHGLEEERRLCYVGMTRAMQRLFLSYAESRRLHGLERMNKPSRFLAEIPQDNIYSVRPTTKISRPTQFTKQNQWNRKTKPAYQSKPRSDTGLRIGQRVEHPKFGTGIVINHEGGGEQARIQVKFDQVGAKWLVASFAKLTQI